MLVYFVCTCELRKSINESIQARSPCGMLVTKMKEIEDGTFVAINRDKRMKYLVETKQCKWGSTYIFPFVCLCVLLPVTKLWTKNMSAKKTMNVSYLDPICCFLMFFGGTNVLYMLRQPRKSSSLTRQPKPVSQIS